MNEKISLLEKQKVDINERKVVIEGQKKKIEASIDDFKKKHKIGDDDSINNEIDEIPK